MAEIGQTLREARMRQRIDVAEAESATKIRAKYLRALENEEWPLLPGPAYVKSFLRTYAEYLGLDGRRLVEEYKQRYERPSTAELTPLRPAVSQRGRRPRRPFVRPLAVVLGVLALLAGALYLLGTAGGDADPEPAATPEPAGAPAGGGGEPRERARPRRVALRIAATGTVEVCLIDARGRRLLDARVLAAGDRTRTFRGRRFRVTFGNGQATMRVGRRTVAVPDRADPIGFEVRPQSRPRELPERRRPVCS